MNGTTKLIFSVVKVVMNVFLTLLIIAISLLVGFTFMTNRNNGEIFVATSYIVQSNSMAPTFEAGSLIITAAVKPENVKAEDIITYRPADYPDTRVTHRVKEVLHEDGRIKFLTQGDANNTVDNAVDQDNLVGKTIFWIPSFGNILNDMRNPFFVVAASVLIALLFGVQFLTKKSQD
ncbi:MAG: signal peptidase I [Clostridiales bacterium]|nr:signal peptidase I [Clostridiales bacterium]